MVHEEMSETMLENVLEAATMIEIPIPTFVIVAAIKNDPCLREAVHLCHPLLVKGLAVHAVPDPKVGPEVHPVAEPERLPVTMYRCQKCRSTFLKVVYLI